MTSIRKTNASRANGALSRGPVTPAGKYKSSHNATRHGLLACCVVLKEEGGDNFEALLQQHLDRLQPADDMEFTMIEEMAASYWRMRRAWAIETRMLQNNMELQPSDDPFNRIVAAFTDPGVAPALSLIHRYETRLHTMYQRALRTFLLLRTAVPKPLDETASGEVEPEMPNEPIPISEQSAATDPPVASDLVDNDLPVANAPVPNEPNPESEHPADPADPTPPEAEPSAEPPVADPPPPVPAIQAGSGIILKFVSPKSQNDPDSVQRLVLLTS